MRYGFTAMAIVVTVVLLLMAVASCGSSGGPDTWDMQQVGSNNSGGTMISRSIDREAGVVCWVYSNGYQDGISCLPLSETNLSADSFPQK